MIEWLFNYWSNLLFEWLIDWLIDCVVLCPGKVWHVLAGGRWGRLRWPSGQTRERRCTCLLYTEVQLFNKSSLAMEKNLNGFKGTVSVILSALYTKGECRFITFPFKPLTDNQVQRTPCTYLWNYVKISIKLECMQACSVTQLSWCYTCFPRKFRIFFVQHGFQKFNFLTLLESKY